MKLIKDKGNVLKAMKQERGDSLKEYNSALIKFQDWNEFGKSPYVGVTVIDTDPDPIMREDERFIFNRHGHLTKIKAIMHKKGK